ncbi:MAG: GNAT family N-acetyltransferase [Ruminococcus sp.]|nr:GNAT family N-acetyltransferase [Ruminococcus sp.]
MYKTRIYRGIVPDCMTVRQTVFVEEQGFENEFDETDESCIHIVVYDGDAPVGTGRVFREADGWYIGRVAVMKDHRKKDLGSMIVLGLEKAAKEQGAEKILLWAQCRAYGFYEKLGYTSAGKYHDDEGCPHVLMEKKI